MLPRTPQNSTAKTMDRQREHIGAPAQLPSRLVQPSRERAFLSDFVAPWATLTHMADSVFSKIIRGEIPCHKLYEDDRVLAFLDIGPLSEGHALVIPKESAVTLDELSDESAAA